MTQDVRYSLITDWHDLPDLEPGEDLSQVIAAQCFLVLHKIRTVVPFGDVTVVRLEIGAVEDVPIELESTEGPVRTYRLGELEALKDRLIETGAAAIRRAIAISPGLEVRVVLRNTGERAVKPRVALIVQEEAH